MVPRHEVGPAPLRETGLIAHQVRSALARERAQDRGGIGSPLPFALPAPDEAVHGVEERVSLFEHTLGGRGRCCSVADIAGLSRRKKESGSEPDSFYQYAGRNMIFVSGQMNHRRTRHR